MLPSLTLQALPAYVSHLARWCLDNLRAAQYIAFGKPNSNRQLAICISYNYLCGSLFLCLYQFNNRHWRNFAFAAVQFTMIGYGFWRGEHFNIQQILRLFIATAGVIWLLLPGASKPNLTDPLIMLTARTAWAIYSLRGRASANAMRVTIGNFMLATIFALCLSLTFFESEDS